MTFLGKQLLFVAYHLYGSIEYFHEANFNMNSFIDLSYEVEYSKVDAVIFAGCVDFPQSIKNYPEITTRQYGQMEENSQWGKFAKYDIVKQFVTDPEIVDLPLNYKPPSHYLEPWFVQL